MSDIKTTTFKRPECGFVGPGTVRDLGGGVIDLQIVGTDPDVGVVNGTTLVADYMPDDEHKNPDGTFLICIEVEGVFYVTLADGSDFVITAVQAAAYLGQWVPMKIYSVNVGTTGSFSVGY